MLSIIIYIICGIFSGFLAGLFGIGGGLITVPALMFCFNLNNVNESVITHLAIGTSMACIIFTSISSTISHNKKNAILWKITKKTALGVSIGSLTGSLLAIQIHENILKFFFIIYVYFASIQILTNKKAQVTIKIPNNHILFFVGNTIGLISSMIGIGGGSISTPLMIWCNIKTINAIATSTTIGLPISIIGTIGYIFGGLNNSKLPPYSIGYVNLPTLISIVFLSILSAPIGAYIAHKISTNKLKYAFAITLILTATNMLIKII